MKTFSIGILALSAALLAVSCVHEYPEDPAVDPTLIDTRITLKTEQSFTHSSILGSRGDGAGYDFMYYVVELHKDQYGEEPVLRREIGARKNGDGSTTVELDVQLHAGSYKGVAYAVAAENADGQGKIFRLDDLTSIGYGDAYPGNTDAKESYEVRFDLNLPADVWLSTYEATELLQSPMGSVEVTSTDAAEFVKHEIARLESLNQKGPDSRSEEMDIEWSNYYVKWSFDMYYPISYNAYTGLPNKAEREVSFVADIVPQNDTEASLGFDYIFVNGQKSQVSLSLELYDKENNLLNVYSGIEVPVERGKTTIIRGEYLTNRKEPGIGIDPGFDGDITIVLPD